MPCVALGQKKVYRASRARKHDRKIRNTQPLNSAEKLKPETAELVKSAQAAVEVAAPTPAKPSSPTEAKSTSVKSRKKVARGLKKLKTGALRRSAVKAARTAQSAASSTAVQTAPSPTPPQPQAAVRLKDGDCIQIRPHRSRTAPKATQPAPAPTPITTQKPARALKKHAKSTVKPKRRLRFRRPSRADLINAESRLGSTIFGPIPEGHRREFFHDRENIWIWHESWTDSEHHARQLTVRYEVRPSGVYKKLSAGRYFKLEGAELENFLKATRTYLRLIKQHLYPAA